MRGLCIASYGGREIKRVYQYPLKRHNKIWMSWGIFPLTLYVMQNELQVGGPTTRTEGLQTMSRGKPPSWCFLSPTRNAKSIAGGRDYYKRYKLFKQGKLTQDHQFLHALMMCNRNHRRGALSVLVPYPNQVPIPV